MLTGSLQIKNDIYYAVLNLKDANGKRKVKWVSTKLSVKGNKRKADDFLNNLKAEYDGTEPKQCNKLLFADYMLKWLEIVKPTIELTTYSSYCQIIKGHIYNYFKPLNVTLTDLSPTHIQTYYQKLMSEGLTGNTVIHHHANIRKALNCAVKSDLIPSNPADKIERPKKEMYLASFYDSNELNELFVAVKSTKLELPVLLSAFYGLRRSEAIGLKWSAVDFVRKTITIRHTITQTNIDGKFITIAKDRTKTKSSYRTLPLVPNIEATLIKVKERQQKCRKDCKNLYNKKYDDYICVDDVGDLIKPCYVSDHFSLVLEKNNLRHIRFHDLRHSCASLLLANGVSMKEIQEWLGHSNFATTANIYAHLDYSTKVASANTLSKALVFG
jgi:integrase